MVKIINPFPGWSTGTIAKEVFLLKHRLPENDRIIRLTHYLHSAHVPQIQLYLEYYDGGDLAKLLKWYRDHSRTLPEPFAWHAFRQIAEGLAFIHCGYDHKLGPNQDDSKDWKKVIHADLKPGNIFLRMSKNPEDYPDLVLADFGNSHTKNDYHTAGTEVWLPPERHYVSDYGDTWTMGAIISSFAWRGFPPARPPRPLSPSRPPSPPCPLHRTFQRGLDSRGPPILIRHRFRPPEPGQGPTRCVFERNSVFVRPMLSYSHELNDLVASASHPHVQNRVTSWDCVQIIWYEMEVGAARSHPFVPLMSGWEPPLPTNPPNHGGNNGANDGGNDEENDGENHGKNHGESAAPAETSGHADDNFDHNDSSKGSNDGGQGPPDQGRTGKRRRIEDDGDEEVHEGKDPANQSSTGKSDENSDKEDINRQDAPDRGSSRKRRRVKEDSDGENHEGLMSPNRGPTGRRRHLEESRDEESHDRQDSPNHGSTGKRRHVEEGDDEEHHGAQDRPESSPTKRRKRVR